MKTILILACLVLAGCATGSSDEAKVKFGIAPIFSVDKTVTGIKWTDKTLKAATSTTEVQIFNFIWTSSAKNLTLSEKK